MSAEPPVYRATHGAVQHQVLHLRGIHRQGEEVQRPEGRRRKHDVPWREDLPLLHQVSRMSGRDILPHRPREHGLRHRGWRSPQLPGPQAGEEQAAREEREAKEEIESNPMLLLENRTQQSQYEMEVLESLEDLREMNDRHAGIDPGKIADRYEKERKMTLEKIEEMERLAALKALGYEMVEGEMVKRVSAEELEDEPVKKKSRAEQNGATDTRGLTTDLKSRSNMKARLAGMIKAKPQPQNSDGKFKKPQEPKSDTKEAAPNTAASSNAASAEASKAPQPAVPTPAPRPNGLSFLGAYSDSESDDST
ncbi:Coiled-coil domain-containing protein 94 [Chionoecetes opilio]|uniref:Coiled-coil domain-containing protein 94 n=1 Tax=Chionoecetes opilio TaxID=41210 RepID=A0A8J5CZ51_CHIOP|nr:Coiled-coil domain-containing protein 94 [Chionoecetes opilio]